jgi:hypothetical protein
MQQSQEENSALISELKELRAEHSQAEQNCSSHAVRYRELHTEHREMRSEHRAVHDRFANRLTSNQQKRDHRKEHEACRAGEVTEAMKAVCKGVDIRKLSRIITERRGFMGRKTKKPEWEDHHVQLVQDTRKAAQGPHGKIRRPYILRCRRSGGRTKVTDLPIESITCAQLVKGIPKDHLPDTQPWNCFALWSSGMPTVFWTAQDDIAKHFMVALSNVCPHTTAVRSRDVNVCRAVYKIGIDRNLRSRELLKAVRQAQINMPQQREESEQSGSNPDLGFSADADLHGIAGDDAPHPEAASSHQAEASASSPQRIDHTQADHIDHAHDSGASTHSPERAGEHTGDRPVPASGSVPVDAVAAAAAAASGSGGESAGEESGDDDVESQSSTRSGSHRSHPSVSSRDDRRDDRGTVVSRHVNFHCPPSSPRCDDIAF